MMEYESDMTTIYYDINGILLYLYIYICISLSLYCFMTLRKSNIAMEHGYINHPTQGIQMGHGFHAEYEAQDARVISYIARPFVEDLS